METNTDVVELLFFDTFAHDSTEEINLDLVQFPKPVYVTEVRIIPLGARVQADFPGGVRLGATNPSQFKIEFFVNDLGKPGASTFETLGGFEYNQNGCINLDCVPNERIRKIPTDGLVLRGWYTTITLAVYGTLTKNITEQIIQPVVVTPTVQTAVIPVVETPEIQKNTIENEWTSDNIVVPVEYKQTTPATYPQSYAQSENYQQEYPEFFAADAPKDPRNYHHTPETNEWEGQKPSRSRNSDVDRERERDRNRDTYPKPPNDHTPRADSDRRSDRDRDKRERSHSYREPRDPDEADWERQPRSRDRGERNRHDDSYRRNYERDERKRPRTPPMLSPKRPRTPHEDTAPLPVEPMENRELTAIVRSPDKEVKSPPPEEVSQETIEEFEPILSDEDILDDPDQFQDDYDYTACTNNDDIIKLFTPGVTPLVKYQKEPIFKVSKEAIEIDEPLKTIIGIVDDYYKSSITKYTVADFEKLNTEIKEEFIHLCEKLIPAISSVENFINIMDLYDKTNALSKENLNPSDREMCAQISFIVQTTIDWVKIALNYDVANIQEQPPYKIRHIKCGVRLIEWCCNSSVFINLLWAEHNFNIHETLLGLYNQEFMALSIKLMVLKALDTYLMHKSGMDKFLLGDSENHKENGSKCLNISENNGYKILLECMNKNASVRLKFALSSLMKKVHLYELLYRLHSILIKLRNTTDVSVEEINLMTKILDQVLQFSRNGNFALSQPKRFLPVAAQFEISREEFRNVLVDYFNIFDLLQCFLLLLTYPGTMNLPAVKTPIFEVLESLLESLEGLEFYSNNLETVNFLLKCLLLQTEDEVQFATQNGIDIKSQNLALKIAYKLQAFHHIECLLDLGKKHNFDCGAFEIIDQLHAFFCLTFSPTGKIAVSEILGIKSNFKALLQFLVVRDKSESQLARIKKSPAIGYIIDLIHFAVTTVPNIVLLETYAKDILHIINYQDMFEEAISSKLNEIKAFISPFDNVSTLSHDNISPFVEIIQKELESASVLSGQLTTSLRILEYLGIPRNASKNTVLNENPLNNYIELKYKHVILQLYSLDGCSILTKLLQKLCDHYEPPHLSVATFVSSQGLFLANTITPCLQLLKQMLTYVIQCRNTQFRDLTSIPVLLQTYTLMGSFPSSAAAYALAQRNCEIIIEMLLVYTQPVSEEVHEKDSLNKTLWSLMVGEVIKYVTTAPHTFISGLLIFSELLPLPLPIQSSDDMSREEITFAVNLRMLWSAHLHPHSTHIQDVIVKLCTTTHPQLLNLLRRVCVQIADLAANSAIMISRGILDAVHDAITPKEGVVIPNARAGKLLNFLACLVTHSPIKCAVLHLINSGNPAILKADEKYSTLIESLTNILKDTSTSNAHVQMQECVLSIIQSFCDSEITLLQNPYNDVKEISSATYLANALPTKDNLVIFVNVLVDHVQNENFFVTYLLAVRTLILLTEHNYGFYYLREHLLKQPGSLCVLLDKLTANFSKVNAVCLSILSTLIEFLRVLLTTEEVEGQLYEPRNIKFKLNEFKSILSWKDEDNENHNLRNLEASLKGIVEEDPTFEAMLEGMAIILRELGTEGDEIKTEVCAEPVLPPPETLLNQFSGRSVYSSVDACDERLTTRYWLAAPNDETDAEIESVTCDLTELCRQSFSLEFNLIREVEKLCKICPSDNITKEKRLDDPKLQKRKPYITPIRTRGFPRTVQQRPDLFRSRPPNTSRPPSLHVDDFVALETCGAQPTGPTGYNKISRELLASTRTSRGSRGRAFASSDRNVHYRQMSWWGSGLGRPPY